MFLHAVCRDYQCARGMVQRGVTAGVRPIWGLAALVPAAFLPAQETYVMRLAWAISVQEIDK